MSMVQTKRQQRQPTLSAAQSADIVAHMNDDHAEAVLLYAKAFGALPRATAATMTTIDETGMDLEVSCGNKSTRVRIAFDQSVQTPGGARRLLVDMAAAARKRLGKKK